MRDRQKPSPLTARQGRRGLAHPEQPADGADARRGSRSPPVSRFMIADRLLLIVER